MEKVSGGSQFDIRKPEYLETFEVFKNPALFNQISSVVGNYLKETETVVRSPIRCLDAMAGTGLVGRSMQRIFPGMKVVYQDGSKRMLSSEVYRESDERILSDAATLGVANKSFDIVFCRVGLNNVAKEKYPQIIEEYLRVLADDGIIILQDHFPQTEEEKKVINELETEVAKMQGIKDATYVPTTAELRELIHKIGGRVENEQKFKVNFSMRERFLSKGIQRPDLSSIRKILKAQNFLEYKEEGEDVIVVYPIITLTLKK